ncbi:MAG: DUF4388 domain-containing protein [Actinomycetota bacterium]
MSLSGNLGFVPLDEVLRLLTRSHQQGSVEVTGDGVRGRIFVGKGGIDLATTFEDDELGRHLINSRYADERTLSRVTSGETTLAAVAEGDTAIVDLLREMTVESLFQIGGKGRDFEVLEGVTTPYASPKSFELEALLRDAEERRREWEQVNEVIRDLTGPITFRRDLGQREEVTVNADEWRVLSEIGAGSSVERVAEHLGTTKFWTARVTARLVEKDLVVITGTTPAPHEAEQNVESVSEEDYDASEPPRPEAAYRTEPVEDHDFHEGENADQTDDDSIEVRPDESWWREPEEDVPEAPADDATPEVVSEGLTEIPSVGSADEDHSDDVEGGTEAFLEKVFSELGSAENEDDSDSEESESEEGHGLLRRRRMGTLRDFSSDS